MTDLGLLRPSHSEHP